jgi:hypothetical protein
MDVAKAALKEDAGTLGGKLSTAERADLQKIANPNLAAAEGSAMSTEGLTGAGEQNEFGTYFSPSSALDFISRQKEKLRGLTADHIPSKEFQITINKMIAAADREYVAAASNSELVPPEIVRNLMKARTDYREVMQTVYSDAIKKALQADPENVGRIFWQSGTMAEVGQLQKLFSIMYREKAVSAKTIIDLQRNMTRGFLQEAVPNVEAAAKWSETLKANPLKRDTWNTLTNTLGGSELKHGMELLEEASKIALRGNKELAGMQTSTIVPLSRGIIGISYVTGAFHPGILIIGLSVQSITRLMATAYTKADKGTLNLIARALKANSAGTAASAKAMQAIMPELEKAGAKYGINPFADEGQQ